MMNQSAGIALSSDRSIQPVAEEDVKDVNEPNATKEKESDSESQDVQSISEPPYSAGVPYVLQREKQQSVNGPALPESPLVNDDHFNSYFPIPSTHSWQPDLTSRSGEIPNSSGIIMPQPTANYGASVDPVPMRSQTPNNLIRSGTPSILRIATPPVIRTGTPSSYLLQRSPSAGGFNIDYDRPQQEKVTRRTMSPKPARSHTPSNSSTSAYNPLVHSSIGSSSRSSIESTGSSYHSSDGELNGRRKEVSNWLFDPESKGTVFSHTEKSKPIKTNGTTVDLSKDDVDSDSKDDTSESIGDQEDVLELLTGLTKKDLTNIQQKLVSAAVTREAEEAIRLSQRRRRPSVQSREHVSLQSSFIG